MLIIRQKNKQQICWRMPKMRRLCSTDECQVHWPDASFCCKPCDEGLCAGSVLAFVSCEMFLRVPWCNLLEVPLDSLRERVHVASRMKQGHYSVLVASIGKFDENQNYADLLLNYEWCHYDLIQKQQQMCHHHKVTSAFVAPCTLSFHWFVALASLSLYSHAPPDTYSTW